MFVALIAALLVAGVTERAAAGHAVADVDFGHEPTEILGSFERWSSWGV